MNKDDIFSKIAKKHLGIETLEVRKSDRLDFHDVAVWGIKDALEDAFTAGQLTATKAYEKMMRGDGGYMGAFEASYGDIIAIFGEPTGGDGYKTEAEWQIVLPRRQVVKIYNYKTSKSYSPANPDIKAVTVWHIGGKNRTLVDRLITMMAGKAKLTHRQEG